MAKVGKKEIERLGLWPVSLGLKRSLEISMKTGLNFFSKFLTCFKLDGRRRIASAGNTFGSTPA